MTERTRRWLIAFAVLGLGASVAATWVHYQLLRSPGYTSFCDVSTTVNCTEAYLSRFGSLGGVPVALLGVLWFVLVLVLLLAPRSSGARENAPAYIFALSTAALSIVLYLAYGSFVVLRTVCPLCVATYVAVGGLFLISGGAMSFPMSHLPGRAARDLRALVSSPAALVLAILFLGGAATAVAFFPREATTAGSGAVGRRTGSGAGAKPGGAERVRALVPSTAHSRSRRSCRRGGGRGRQVQRLPVPAVQADLRRLQERAGEVPHVAPRRRRAS